MPYTVFRDGAVAVRIIPSVLTGGKIASLGSLLDLDAIADPGFEITNTEKVEKYERRLSTGTTLQIPKISTYYDPINAVAASVEGDMFNCTLLCTYANLKYFASLVQAAEQVPLFVAFAPILDSGGAPPGWAHFLAKINGNFKFDGKEGISEVPVSFKGCSFATVPSTGPTFTAYNTAMTGTNITPYGKTSIAIADIATGDWANVLAGKITIVDV